MIPKICKKCGKEFLGCGSARYCQDCNPYKNSQNRFFIEAGKSYGMVQVLERADLTYFAWVCRCKKCGQKFVGNATAIKKNKNGCGECRKEERRNEKIKKSKEYIGKTYGNLKIIEIDGCTDNEGNNWHLLAKCECMICGSISDIPLQRLKKGGASKCKKCSLNDLEKGREIAKEFQVDGTLISAINGKRNINKNSTTGYNGVSQMKSGTYRAYITFRRKQYRLGSYSDIEDAIAARKRAEKEIYGNFLEWYAKEYPDKWEKINRPKQMYQKHDINN